MVSVFAAAALAATALTATAFYAPTPAEAAPKADPVAKPPMGWNTWYSYKDKISYDKIMDAAKAIAAPRLVGVAPNVVDKGLKAVGYEYIGIDDGWSAGRYKAGDPEVTNNPALEGTLKPDPVKFPNRHSEIAGISNGMQSLAYDIHKLGLKLGLYAAPMTKTCAGYVGSFGHEHQDANTFADWGVDLLKYDWCNSYGNLAYQQTQFALMRDELKKAGDRVGRKIVYNINPGSMHTAEFANFHDFGDYADTVRAGEDLLTTWWENRPVPSQGLLGTLDLVDVAAQEVFRNAPDRWVDWDYVQLGRVKEDVGLVMRSDGEDRAQFAMWAMSGGPLFFVAEPATLNWDEVKTDDSEKEKYLKKITKILTNKDLIAVNQSWGGSGGRRISKVGDAEVWAKPLENGDVAVALLNRGEKADNQTITVSTGATRVGLGGYSSYTLTDLWTDTTSNTSGAISAAVPSRDVKVYRLHRTDMATLVQPPKAQGTYQLDGNWWSTVGSYGTVPVEVNKSFGPSGQADGNTLTIGGKTYPKGLGTHADSGIYYWLGGSCQQFSAEVGIDDEVDSTVPAGQGRVQFGVYGDGRLLAYTDIKTPQDPATTLNVPIAGVKLLELRAIPTNHTYQVPDDTTPDPNDMKYTNDRERNDHADWADAKITCTGTARAASFSSDLVVNWDAQPNGWGHPEKDRSNNGWNPTDGSRIKVNGVYYPKGIGAHANSDITINKTGCSRFTAVGGVDDETEGRGTVKFKVLGVPADGSAAKELYASPTVTPSKPVFIDVPITGYDKIRLVADDAGDDNTYDHADWAGAVHSC
ncbi:NPCBM/NEW2 domain-containing protein [Streptomyces sp. NBC_00322]|uniref:NPCBM/NEW2 domain-containing protein n=1 Tax=Streptomyces sp. NBC_00322 TaxID=2975712 RepID=UPI002E2BB3A8|nr:NPCBM/NEW2 domain-containing protein [Streptomyces sp. NBC_00322]